MGSFLSMRLHFCRKPYFDLSRYILILERKYVHSVITTYCWWLRLCVIICWFVMVEVFVDNCICSCRSLFSCTLLGVRNTPHSSISLVYHAVISWVNCVHSLAFVTVCTEVSVTIVPHTLMFQFPQSERQNHNNTSYSFSDFFPFSYRPARIVGHKTTFPTDRVGQFGTKPEFGASFNKYLRQISINNMVFL